MKTLTYLLGKSLALFILPLLCCQNNIATTIDPTIQVAGVYKVHYLQVFDEMIDTSHDFTGIVTITKIDVSHVKLGMDIRYIKDEPMPVETLCTLQPIQSKIHLIETNTNLVLGYIENQKIHLISFDSKGAKTIIVGSFVNE